MDKRDRIVYAALAVVGVLARLPFLRTFDVVTFDGTVYLNEAKALVAATKLPGAFPVGYPAAVALFHFVIPDWVRAGQAVSFASGVAATLVLYGLARRHAGRVAAILAALLLSLNPLFIRLSLVTMSEALYILLVLVGLLMLVRERFVRAGLALGAAAATRPEALAVAAVAAALGARRPRRALAMAGAFIAVFALNAAVLSWSQGVVVLLPKASWLGSSAENWKAKERAVEFEGPEAWKETPGPEEPPRGLVAEYLHAMPRELRILAHHTYPGVLLLAVVGIARMRAHVFLAPLVPLVFFTAFTKRSEHRYLLPYVPILILYAAIGLEALKRRALRWSALALLVAGGAALPFVERAQLVDPDELGLANMKAAGIALRSRVERGDRVADRKPYVAFYAGATYVEIPVAPYEDTMRHLAAEGVEWLALHRETIHRMRPALRPLMYSKAVINGELRYDQAYADSGEEMVFRRSRDADPLRWTQLTTAAQGDFMPAWSPDGQRIAYRSQRSDGRFELAVLTRQNRALAWSPDNVEATALVGVDDSRDPLAWSPDGSRIAFSGRAADPGRADADIMAVDVYSGGVTTLVGGPGDERSPSWSSANELAFVAGPEGQGDVWILHLDTRGQTQLTQDGGYAFPVFSPDGRRVACLHTDGLAVIDRDGGRVVRALTPRQLAYAPAWSPDGAHIVVTAEDWGSWDVYLMTADAGNVLLLTKHASREGMPAWSSDGARLAVMSDRSGTFSLWMLDDFGAYLERLESSVRMDTFTLAP